MEILMDRSIRELLTYFKAKLEQVEIEIGCGSNKSDGRIDAYCLALPGVDVIVNLEERLGAFPDHCTDEPCAGGRG